MTQSLIENPRAVIGGNLPPDPIAETMAPYAVFLEESGNWLDGQLVETEAQMKAVDTLIAAVRKCKTDLERAEKVSTAPLHDAWKAEIARWKPFREDVERRLKGLTALVSDFKKRLDAEKEAERRRAYEAQRAAEAALREAEAKASATDLASMEEADRLKREAEAARVAASEAKADKVTGLRTVTKWEITDHRLLVNWIAQNDRAALTAFIEDYARKHHKSGELAGVRVWTEKEAY